MKKHITLSDIKLIIGFTISIIATTATIVLYLSEIRTDIKVLAVEHAHFNKTQEELEKRVNMLENFKAVLIGQLNMAGESGKLK